MRLMVFFDFQSVAYRILCLVPFALLIFLTACQTLPDKNDSQENVQETKAISTLIQRAQEGDTSAMFQLAGNYIEVQKDMKEGIRWLENAARHDYVEAQFYLGTIHLEGVAISLGVPFNNEKAAYWFEKAAIAGYPDAQDAIATMHYKGQLERPDKVLGYAWALCAEKGKYPKVVTVVSSFPIYLTESEQQEAKVLAKNWQPGKAMSRIQDFVPEITPNNEPETIKKLREKASAGELASQLQLAQRYSSGTDIPKNYPEAAKWYKLAALSGDVESQIMLGEIYMEGRGVAKDIPKAIEWMEIAASNGNAVVQLHVGMLYSTTRELQSKKLAGLVWMLCSAKDDKSLHAHILEITKNLYTDEERLEAEEMAATWIRSSHDN